MSEDRISLIQTELCIMLQSPWDLITDQRRASIGIKGLLRTTAEMSLDGEQASSPNDETLGGVSAQTLRLMRLLGQTSASGKLRTEGRDKIAQVLAFLPVMGKVLKKTSKRRSIRFLECASGKGHLSLLLNQILSERTGRRIEWVGIDSSTRLISRCRSIAKEMGYDNVEYNATRILDYSDARAVTALISLHACDTATDEALVKGIQLGSRFILLVPCCHREVAAQLRDAVQLVLLPLTQNATHRRVLGGLVTDALRRLVLESFGYHVDVFEYVSVRRTEKNVMIRGELGSTPDESSWRLYLHTTKALRLRLTLDELLDGFGLQPPFTLPRGAASSRP